MNWLQMTSGSKALQGTKALKVQRMHLMKVIPLRGVALRLEMGKLRKHDNLWSTVSKHGLAA